MKIMLLMVLLGLTFPAFSADGECKAPAPGEGKLLNSLITKPGNFTRIYCRYKTDAGKTQMSVDAMCATGQVLVNHGYSIVQTGTDDTDRATASYSYYNDEKDRWQHTLRIERGNNSDTIQFDLSIYCI